MSKTNDTTIETFVFTGNEKGPRLLILGAVHGNEKCGTQAIRRVIDEIKSGIITIKRGRLTFAPICNPRAYAQDMRFTERNLNRFLLPMDKPDCYEAELGNILCPLLADTDALLDIHSYTVGGPPFISLEDWTEDGQKFAESLGGEAILFGWDAAYLAAGRPDPDPNESIGTTGYARRCGAVSVLIECGQHKDPQSPEVAYRAIRNALRYWQMTDEAPQPNTLPAPRQVVLKDVFFKLVEGGHFTKPWQHLQPVTKGDILAIDGEGKELRVPQDSLVLLPKEDTPVGSEWLYLGIEK